MTPREPQATVDETRARPADVDPHPEPDAGSEAASETGGATSATSRRRLRRRPVEDDAERREREREDRVLARITAQWAQLREDRDRRLDAYAATPRTAATSGRVTGTGVPPGVELAASWGWRLLVIAGAGYLIFWLLGYFSVLTLPLAIALLIAALTSPLVQGLRRLGLPKGLAAILVVVGLLALIGLLLTYAGQQVASGAQDLADSTVEGIGQIKLWLKDGPLHASDTQIDSYLQNAQQAIQDTTADSNWFAQATEIGTTVGHVLAGFFIVLFASYFFLADGDRIWAWLVRLTPRLARERVDSSGRIAWISLTQFVRATVIVAAVDAIGIMVGAAVLQVPFVLAIGVLVFLGAFVPMIGAALAGSVAVLVALVDQGPVTALFMLAVIVLVQQLEGHVLQPFLMGRWVSVHPLGVIIAIAAGVIVGGIAGALVAVPLAAAVNAVVVHLAASTGPESDPEEELADDYDEMGVTSDPEKVDEES